MSDNRPTMEQLQTALTVADQSRPPHYVAVLAAEVRALQRELALFRAASEAAELRIVELRDAITRVEALSKGWRFVLMTTLAEGAKLAHLNVVHVCIDALERALRGTEAEDDAKLDMTPAIRDARNEIEAPYKAVIARVQALCDMQHSDRLIRVGDIRAALRGHP